MITSGGRLIGRSQRTLRKASDVVGVGLHTGKRIRMRILPADADRGITFVRTDLGNPSVTLGLPANGSAAKILRADHATTLAGDGFTITTVEHLMAAFRGLGVDNATVLLSGDEVPIMDGSAAPFVYLIREAGLRELGVPRRMIQLKRPVGVLDGDREVTIYPADHFRITYTIDFTHPAIGRQTLSYGIDEETFVEEVAPARTFCLLKDVQELRKRGLALGGSLANAVVVGDQGPLNDLRFHDEYVRHKTLDLVGDLALLGYPILGHVVAHKAGHAMHSRLLMKLMESRDAWDLTAPAHRPAVAATAMAGSNVMTGAATY